MRVLLFVNLLAIVVIAGALARIYEGTRLPWAHDQIRLDVSDLSQLNTDALPSVSVPLTPNPNPHRGDEVTSTEELPAVLMVATEGAYPPFNGRDAGGELNGYDIDIARALCERIKRTCKFVTYKWQELLPVLKRGEVDVVIASMLVPAVPDNGKIVFSDPYYKTPGHFAARRDAQLGIGGVTSSNMQSIAVQAGSTHEAFLKVRFPDAKLLTVKTLEEAEAALVDRHAALLFGDRNALLNWMLRGGGDGCCRMVGGDYDDPVYFARGAGVAMRSDQPGLRMKINQAISDMANDGTETRIARAYFGQSIR
ncbi:MAG: transporter substrate-binding domain-containing protein [Parvibaculum sp.]|nr:transporter substrate-binding domain-containing protein [Parvibaculum sp.]|tara:strand:+ start:6202 stop:7131 length:930 start_codon:yes stop_codon:yes gene_type:complete